MSSHFDYLIIGAGPAGLQLGYFLKKSNRDYLILEAGSSAGTFFKEFPRHEKLISINKVYTGYDNPEINLRWDWNSLLSDDPALLFKHYSKEYFPSTKDLTRYLHDFATQLQLKVQYNSLVTHISKASNQFQITDQEGNLYTSNRLIIATGFTQPYVPPIPGIEFAENYTEVSIEPEDFKNQKVLIIGKGNSGFETADNLISTASLIHIASPSPISMAWKSKYVGHLRAVNNNFLDTYQLKSQNGVLDAKVVKIERRGDQLIASFDYSHANDEKEDITYDRIIICAGFQFNSTIFDEACRPELTINNRFPAQTSEWESTNISNLYFAGVLMHMRDFKKKQSGFIHGFRYNIRTMNQIFEQKYHGHDLPFQTIKATPEAITTAILDHVNTSSGLWQQTGFLSDLIVISNNGQEAKYYKELPNDYIHDSTIAKSDHYYTVSLEFGHDVNTMPDPFAINRKPDPAYASDSAFIHPIIRRYYQGTLVCEHHLIEDLGAEWRKPMHVDPLVTFLRNQLSNSDNSFAIHSSKNSLRHSFKFSTPATSDTARVQETQKRPDSNARTKRLGEYLIEAGLLKTDQLMVALEEQSRVGLRLGEVIAYKGWISQHTIDYLVTNVMMPDRNPTQQRQGKPLSDSSSQKTYLTVK